MNCIVVVVEDLLAEGKEGGLGSRVDWMESGGEVARPYICFDCPTTAHGRRFKQAAEIEIGSPPGGREVASKRGLEAIQSLGSFRALSLPVVDCNRPPFLWVVRAGRFTLGTAIV